MNLDFLKQYTPFDASQPFLTGTYRFALSYPLMISGWAPAFPLPVTTSLSGYALTAKDYSVSGQTVTLTVDIVNIDQSPQAAPGAGATYLANPYAPSVRYGGGWVKAGAANNGMADISTAAPPIANNVNQPNVIPAPEMASALGALIGVAPDSFDSITVEIETTSVMKEVLFIGGAALLAVVLLKSFKGAV